MNALIVVSDPSEWQLDLAGVRIVAADEYLSEPAFADEPRLHVFNLCSSLRYQRSGYYVSLLAEARGHRPMPSIGTVQDLKSPSIVRVASADLEESIERSFRELHGDSFELSVYFGRNVARRHDALAAALFRTFQAPLLRAAFKRRARSGRWAMQAVSALDWSDVPVEHHAFLRDVARQYFSGSHPAPRRRPRPRFDLAILRDDRDAEPASDRRAIKHFVKAGETVGFAVEVIDREASSRTAEFDALFIRDTTSVNHYTYRFARKAKAQGLVVLDDPDAIIRCMNKVYLAELMTRNKVPMPRTLIVHKGARHDVAGHLGLPCVLKQPDSAFSAGVVKVQTAGELHEQLDRLLEKSSLVVAQEYMPTDFDWRVGVLDGQPLYACRYYMARRHWQIIKHDYVTGAKDEGRFDTVPVEQVPTRVVKCAVKAAAPYGDGLFGVDLKQTPAGVVVIEVNDNPSLDGGVEDVVLKDELYLRIMRWFMARVEQRKRAGGYA